MCGKQNDQLVGVDNNIHISQIMIQLTFNI